MHGKKTQVGYNRNLLVLPFDHRGSFQEKLFGIKGRPTAEQHRLICDYKGIIYRGFELALDQGLSQDEMALLVDDQFGSAVIRDAKNKGYTVCVPAEKSGQEEFDFEYGSEFEHAIEKTNPDFVKVLVRYNPAGDEAMNTRQAQRLYQLSDYLTQSGRYFMFELLVPPTPSQLAQCGGSQSLYDTRLRPQLMVDALLELQQSHIEPDVWKLEGLAQAADYQRVCDAARQEGRGHVGVIVLGRGEDPTKVKEWLQAAASVPGVIGFAVGRTLFWEPLKACLEKKISTEEAAQQIAHRYSELCLLWRQIHS